MASLTIRNIDDQLKRKLKVRAARNGLSMEEDLRRALKDLVSEPVPQRRSEAETRGVLKRSKAISDAPDQADQAGDCPADGPKPIGVLEAPSRSEDVLATASASGEEAVRERVARVLRHARRPEERTDWKAATDELYDFLP